MITRSQIELSKSLSSQAHGTGIFFALPKSYRITHMSPLLRETFRNSDADSRIRKQAGQNLCQKNCRARREIKTNFKKESTLLRGAQIEARKIVLLSFATRSI